MRWGRWLSEMQTTEARAVTAIGNCIFYTPRVVVNW